MTNDELSRRSVLKAAATATVVGGFAGCSSSAAPKNSTETPTSTPEPTSGSESGGSSGGGSGSSDSSFGGWMDNVSNYDGVVDKTGSSKVTVTVGAEGNGGGFAFAPAAMKVSKGTTVVWEWTGKGGSHNVEAKDGRFKSEISGEKGHTFERTFDSRGTVKYFCMPHKAMGMKGVIVVE